MATLLCLVHAWLTPALQFRRHMVASAAVGCKRPLGGNVPKPNSGRFKRDALQLRWSATVPVTVRIRPLPELTVPPIAEQGVPPSRVSADFPKVGCDQLLDNVANFVANDPTVSLKPLANKDVASHRISA